MATISTGRAKSLEKKATEAAHLLEALANPRRLMILCELADGERSVGDLATIVGLQQAALSQHLARLRAQGIVATRRQSQMIFYRLASTDAAAVINTLADIFCRPSRDPTRNKRART